MGVRFGIHFFQPTSVQNIPQITQFLCCVSTGRGIRMNKVTFTNKTLTRLKSCTSPYFIRDSSLKGFGVKVNPSGTIKSVDEVWWTVEQEAPLCSSDSGCTGQSNEQFSVYLFIPSSQRSADTNREANSQEIIQADPI
jgi:hypothetical protein